MILVLSTRRAPGRYMDIRSPGGILPPSVVVPPPPPIPVITDGELREDTTFELREDMSFELRDA